MNNRDMYYGYGGFTPFNNMQDFNSIPNNYDNSLVSDIQNRIERLERQVKRLDQRLTRLETPYANNTDNDMYIM